MGRLSIVVLFTPEFARQREFYEKSLGLSAAGSAAGDAATRWVQFVTRDAVLALRSVAAGQSPRIELGFDVPGLDAHLKLLKARGVEPKGDVEDSADCRIARVHDPEGNVVQLVERREPTTSGHWPRLSHAIVNAQQFEACAHFYHDALGFKMAQEREHWIEFDTGGARLTLHAWRDADGLPLSPDQRVSFALMDDDLDAWADELRERGVRFATTPTEEEMGRMAEVEDADGWFVVLRGPSPEVPLEEELAKGFADEDETRIEQIRKTGETDPGARPGFGSRKLARKKVERVATRGFDVLQRSRDAERGGFAPGGSGSRPGFAPGGPPRSPRSFTPGGDRPPRPEGARPFTPSADRPPRPEGSRPFTPSSGPRDRPPRSDGPRPFSPSPDRPSRPPRPFTPRPAGPPREGGARPTGGYPSGSRPAGGSTPSGPRQGEQPSSGRPPSAGPRPRRDER